MGRKTLAVGLVLVLVLAAVLADCGRSPKVVPAAAPAPADKAVVQKTSETQAVEALASGLQDS
ncbi:MAG: hypothetical protein ACPLPT_01600 [Moorellales bacterium]